MNKIGFIPFHPHSKDSTMQARRLLVKNADIKKSLRTSVPASLNRQKKAEEKYNKMIIKNLHTKIPEMLSKIGSK